MSAAPASKLDDAARVALLERAIRIEARSLAHYFARSAAPVDAASRPEVARALASIARAEEDGIRELASRIEEIGGRAHLSVPYDPRFTAYNYVSSAHALGAVAKDLASRASALEALAREASADMWVSDALAEALARRKEHAALVADLRARLAPGTKPA